MSRPSFRIVLASVAVSLLALTGCSSSTATPETIPATVDLEVRAVSGLKFDKTLYEATAGDIEIAYINDDLVNVGYRDMLRAWVETGDFEGLELR